MDKYRWESVYRAALLETNNQFLASRIQEAELAIKERMRHLKSSVAPDTTELQAVLDAHHNLDTLRRELSRGTN